MIKIAIDAMGGDYAPNAVIEGVEQARDLFEDTVFLLYGQRDVINAQLKNRDRIQIINADEVITMEDEPVRAVRRKKHSSIVMAAQAVKDGQADAFFSAGNSGAVLAAGLFIVGRIKGIDRPGLVTVLPVVRNTNQSNFVMMDIGANADSKPLNLQQYGVLGTYYAERMMQAKHPRVALLNNGTEDDKGNKVHKAAFELLSQTDGINFVGNVESRDLLNGVADVVVTDGFTGNAVLKSIEGTARSMLGLVKDAVYNTGISGKLGGLLLKNGFNEIRSQMDYSQYGGAVLLGLKAPVVKTHGSSKAPTIVNTIRQIRQMVSTDIVPGVAEYFANQQANQQASVDIPAEND
ncbi:phosphate acyltransferase PlsX [Lactiplantibacillus plantarum]|uniref:phosphate acyltransferase PlsX n=1 Tax=Lactiplantibacillus plantarum TaxID=1590 RepID=UPI000BEA8E08|nr:phosphate acyltransferase PlsX [Lactiplantibacillus plantarum]MCZ2139317.1 phosphate acyltransferase PlsX [Lactiplantibacillus plantarum]MCZ2275804.1 phosphate acyltransferase PlsX [Lactiplantibacillus plantarum]